MTLLYVMLMPIISWKQNYYRKEFFVLWEHQAAGEMPTVQMGSTQT